MRTPRQRVRMDFDQNMGELYPFTLRRKLGAITEPSWVYDPAEAGASAWGRPIIPFEMLSVLFQHSARQDGFPLRGPAVGLFADQEIRLFDGPLFVAEDYELEREIVALSSSRRTESLWVRTRVMRPGSGQIRCNDAAQSGEPERLLCALCGRARRALWPRLAPGEISRRNDCGRPNTARATHA
jgi:hypothetical protein